MGSGTSLDQFTVGIAGEKAILRRYAASMVSRETTQEKKKSENLAPASIALRKERDSVKGHS